LIQSGYYLGIDVGTSGVRAIAIDANNAILSTQTQAFSTTQRHTPEAWWQAVIALLEHTCTILKAHTLTSICVDATSSSLLLSDASGKPLTPALMYYDQRAQSACLHIQQHAPANAIVQSATSSLAKYLYLRQHVSGSFFLQHQADWILGQLSGNFHATDEHNALKMGYDPINQCWPTWLASLDIDLTQLPTVLTPGTPIGHLTPALRQSLGLAHAPTICAGTTDSTAAFIATGATQPGDAVTSLGSSLVVKVLSEHPVNDPKHGIYSHRLRNQWIVGGASNSGCHVLQTYFSDEQIALYSQQIQPDHLTGLQYYPLTQPGERFPDNDPNKLPHLSPRPDDPAIFFQGILEGITAIEQTGYQALVALGANAPTCIYSVGGGSHNTLWTKLRSQQLNLPMKTPKHHEAAYGAALLAKAHLG